MDLCTGGDLKKYLQDYGVQGDVQVARMLKDMMSAVYYLHEHGIVHRCLIVHTSASIITIELFC
jgi:serine/threonine protein kinase